MGTGFRVALFNLHCKEKFEVMDLGCQKTRWQAQERGASGWGRRRRAAETGDKEGAEGEDSLGAGDAERVKGLFRYLQGPGSIICVHIHAAFWDGESGKD